MILVLIVVCLLIIKGFYLTMHEKVAKGMALYMLAIIISIYGAILGSA